MHLGLQTQEHYGNLSLSPSGFYKENLHKLCCQWEQLQLFIVINITENNHLGRSL